MPPPNTYLGEDLPARVRKTLAAHDMLAPGLRVLVAVSGGADSVALARVLAELGYPLAIAHLDHGTRGEESAVDAAFTELLAATLDVPYYHDRRDVPGESAASPHSLEQYARKVRYDFLLETASTADCAAIATGHQADDQAETVLMRLLRGTGPAGLAGIPPVRFKGTVRIVRPLIACSRAAIRTWLEEIGQAWREDASNRDLAFERNRVRHCLLHDLARDYNPRVREALVRLAEAQRCENSLLESFAEDALGDCARGGQVDRALFSGLHPALQRRCFRAFAWDLGVDCSFEHTCRGAEFVNSGGCGQHFDLGAGITLVNTRTGTGVLGETLADRTGVPLPVPGNAELFGSQFEAAWLARKPACPMAEYCSPARQVFDADAIRGELRLRSRREGDRFTPWGMRGTRKLKKYLIDLGVPARERSAIPLLTDEAGILWVIGHATSARAAVTAKTKRLLEVRVLPGSQDPANI